MRVFPLLLLPLLLAACSGPNTKIIDSSIQGVTVRYDGSDSELNNANDLAKGKCAEYGRASALLNTSEQKESYVATYRCESGQ